MPGLTLRCRSDQGAVVVFTSLLLGAAVLLGMGVLVVDVGMIYVERERLQTGADSAGLTVAMACASGGCTTASAVTAQRQQANEYANRSRNTGDGLRTEITELCGNWGALPACGTSTTGGLGRCLGAAPAGTYLEVRVQVQNAANTAVLPPTFGRALLGSGHDGTQVAACARYTAITNRVIPALWANSTAAGALRLMGAGTVVNGLIHSNADIDIAGNNNVYSPRIEYVPTYRDRGNATQAPVPVQVSASVLAGTLNVADYRPGGSGAVAAGSTYRPIPASSCTGGPSGTWTVNASALPSGVVYVPCGIRIISAGTINATIVAEGPIQIMATNMTLNPAVRGMPALVSNSTAAEAVDVSGGASVNVNGGIQALRGGVTLETGGDRYRCGVVANTILITSNGGRIDVDSSCLATTDVTITLIG